MKKALPKYFLFFIAIVASYNFEALRAGGIDVARLKQLKNDDSPSFGQFAKAVSEAIEFSNLRMIQRSKLPGVYRFYFEAGGSALDVNDQRSPR